MSKFILTDSAHLAFTTPGIFFHCFKWIHLELALEKPGTPGFPLRPLRDKSKTKNNNSTGSLHFRDLFNSWEVKGHTYEKIYNYLSL